MTRIEAAIDGALVEQTGSIATVRRDEHVYNCPVCGREGHFYVNYRKGVYNCFVCGDQNPDARGSVRKLAGILGVEWEDDRADTEIEDTTGEAVARDDESPVPLPTDFELLSPASVSRQLPQFCYLQARGLSWEDMLMYRLGTAFAGSRIIFPDFNAYGQVRWWLGRALGNHVKPKYKGPSGERWGKIGNYHRALAVSSSWIGVCEGPVDAIIAGPEFTWLWGKGHTEEQVEVLAGSGRKIVVALDGELRAVGSARSLVEDLKNLGAECLFCGVPAGEDPASVGRIAFRRLLAATLTEGQTLNELNYLRLAAEAYS